MPLSEWLFTPLTTVLMTLLSGILIYIWLMICTRLAGLRSFAKMSSFDFAITVAVGSTLAGVILTRNPPVAQGMAALGTLFAIQTTVAYLRRKSDAFIALADNKPRLLMSGSEMLQDQMAKARVTDFDLRAKLRQAGITNYDQVHAVIIETSGDISVLKKESGDLDRALLQDVIAADRLSYK